jgi:hypothetical protein
MRELLQGCALNTKTGHFNYSQLQFEGGSIDKRDPACPEAHALPGRGFTSQSW